jgi:hypothetical protein
MPKNTAAVTLVDDDDPPALAQPGDPGYDWTADYGTDDLYLHKFPDGKVVALKPFGSIYSKTWMYKLRKAKSDAEIEFAAIDRAASDTARGVLENLEDTDGDPIADLFAAWVAAGTKRGDGDDGLTAGN